MTLIRPFWSSPDPVPETRGYPYVPPAETEPVTEDEQAARELLDEAAAAAGRAWIGKEKTRREGAGWKDWPAAKGSATGGGAG